MWVRSLSLPPPHPLVLTGKGRSFLQPKLPPSPTETLFLSLCVLHVSHTTQKVRVFAAFTAGFFLWWLVAFFVRFFGLVRFLGGVGTPLSFISSRGIIYWFTVIFCSHLHGVVHQ